MDSHLEIETARLKRSQAKQKAADDKGRTGLKAGFLVAEQSHRASYSNLETTPLRLAMMLQRKRPNNPEHLTALDAARLIKLAKSKAALAVAACNYQLSPRQESRAANIGEEIRLIASWYGFTAETSGDPRGYVVRLHGPDVIKTGWGDGFGVG